MTAPAALATAPRWAHSYQPHSIRSHHASLGLRLGHTAGRVLELSRAFGAPTFTIAQGKSDLPFHLEVREIMDCMILTTSSPQRLTQRPVHRCYLPLVKFRRVFLINEIFPDPVLNRAKRTEEQSAAMLAFQKEPGNVH